MLVIAFSNGGPKSFDQIYIYMDFEKVSVQ